MIFPLFNASAEIWKTASSSPSVAKISPSANSSSSAPIPSTTSITAGSIVKLPSVPLEASKLTSLSNTPCSAVTLIAPPSPVSTGSSEAKSTGTETSIAEVLSRTNLVALSKILPSCPSPPRITSPPLFCE